MMWASAAARLLRLTQKRPPRCHQLPVGLTTAAGTRKRMLRHLLRLTCLRAMGAPPGLLAASCRLRGPRLRARRRRCAINRSTAPDARLLASCLPSTSTQPPTPGSRSHAWNPSWRSSHKKLTRMSSMTPVTTPIVTHLPLGPQSPSSCPTWSLGSATIVAPGVLVRRVPGCGASLALIAISACARVATARTAADSRAACPTTEVSRLRLDRRSRLRYENFVSAWTEGLVSANNMSRQSLPRRQKPWMFANLMLL